MMKGKVVWQNGAKPTSPDRAGFDPFEINIHRFAPYSGSRLFRVAESGVPSGYRMRPFDRVRSLPNQYRIGF
jgi:hypothetical protein